MGKPTSTFNLLRLCIEHVYECGTNGLSLGLGVSDTFQFLEEQWPRMNAYHVESHLFVGVEHFLKLVFAQETVVHENASEVFPYRLIQQNGGHGAVDATREA